MKISNILTRNKTKTHQIISLFGFNFNIKRSSSYILKEENKTLKIDRLNLLKNYPIKETKNTKVFLLNDTRRDEGHIGCNIVINTIKTLCEKSNLDIVFYDKDTPSFETDVSEYENILKQIDLVIFNGEGTLHHNKGINFIHKCLLAKKLGKKVVLINATWQKNELIEKYLHIFDLISTRESYSKSEIENVIKKDVLLVPDLTFYKQILSKTNNLSRKILFTDSIVSKIKRILLKESKKIKESVFYDMRDCKKQGAKILDIDVLEHLSQDSLMITGRFHALALALSLGIPSLCFPSNTYKVEGLLKDAGLSSYLLNKDEDITKQINAFIKKDHSEYKEKAKIYSANARLAIENLFLEITKITKG